MAHEISMAQAGKAQVDLATQPSPDNTGATAVE